MASVNGVAFAGMNPTSAFIPININGTFVDSNIQQGTLFGSPTFELNAVPKISADFYNTKFLYLDVMNNLYSFGSAAFSIGAPNVNVGMGITGNKVVISNYSGWDSTFGVFQSDSSTGVTSIGVLPGASIGVSSFGSFSMLVGSWLFGAAPEDPRTPTNWIIVKDENNIEYRIAAYQ